MRGIDRNDRPICARADQEPFVEIVRNSIANQIQAFEKRRDEASFANVLCEVLVPSGGVRRAPLHIMISRYDDNFFE